jgi:hypothetical protein
MANAQRPLIEMLLRNMFVVPGNCLFFPVDEHPSVSLSGFFPNDDVGGLCAFPRALNNPKHKTQTAPSHRNRL